MSVSKPSPDVIVIGAGVIGLASALELRRRGLRVTVLERGRVGPGGASWAGGGILAPLDPADTPSPVRAMLQQSLRVYARWCEELHACSGVDPQYRACGMQVQAPAAIADWIALGADCGFEVRAGDAGSADLQCPSVAQVRSPRLLRALAGAFRAAGGDLVEDTPVLRIEAAAGSCTVFTAGHRSRSAARCMVAAGSRSGGLCAAPGLRPVKGQMLLLQAEPGEPDRIVLGQGRYLIPRADGLVVAGSTVEDAFVDEGPTAQARDAILDSVARLWPGLERRPVLAHWTGLRPMMPDGLPRLAWLGPERRVYLHCGHYRLGLSLAPASAIEAADAIVASL